MKSFYQVLTLLSLASLALVSGFVPLHAPTRRPGSVSSAMIDPASAFGFATLGSSMILAETEAWVQPTATFLDPFLNLLSFAMLARVVLSWYPETTITKMPWVLLVFPTEPLLRAVKGFVPPAFGVDSKYTASCKYGTGS
jgi:uncharacterized protein YggT (Ycf19 family)